MNLRNYSLVLLSFITILLIQCTPSNNPSTDAATSAAKDSASNGGFGSQVLYGEHLVTVCGCNDCHTPKKMTAQGPVPDSSLWLSGHPAAQPAPAVDRADMAKRGLAVTDMLTCWVGPWGTTYAPNLTSDPTGIGNWTEQQFITCIREGKLKGMFRDRKSTRLNSSH